jgi:hypothetical protein
MSVRKASAPVGRRGQIDRWKAIKGAGFWAFMMIACFIFGLLVVSPLVNLAGGGSRQDAQAALATNNPPPPAPLPSAPAVSATPSRSDARSEDKHEKPDIDVTPDRGQGDVQQPDSVDRSDHASDDKRDGATSDPDRQKPESVDRSDPDRSTDVRSEKSSDVQKDEESPRPRRHRRHSKQDTDTDRSDDTQKSESVED